MKTRKVMPAAQSDGESATKKNFAQNAVTTIKILAGFCALGAALWGIEQWVAVK